MHRTSRLAAPLAALAAALAALAGCTYGSGTCSCRADEACVGGRCLAVTPLPPGDFQDARATPVDCGPFTLLAGGMNPAAPLVEPACPPVPPPRGSALPAAAPGGFGFTDLGEHAVGEVVTFTVPAGAVGFTLLEQAVSAPGTVTLADVNGAPLTVDNAAVPLLLAGPDGATFYDDRLLAPADGSGQPLFYAGGAANTGALSYPDTTAGLAALEAGFAAGGGVAAGTWRVTVGDWAYECWLDANRSPPPASPLCDAASAVSTGRYRLALLTAPTAAAGAASAVPARGRLDVAFHLVDATSPAGGVVPIGLDSAQAVTEPHLQRMVASYALLLRNAGLCLSSATFYDEPTWVRRRFATGVIDGVAGPCGNLPQLLALSVPGARTLELFLVPRLSVPDSSGAVVEGLDATVPGPGTVNGTATAGAVVSAEDLFHEAGACPPGGPLSLSACGADLVAYVAAHESGHFLGLYHTTELDGSAFDPLDDTPHCECVPECGHSPGSCGAGLPASGCVQGRPQCSGGANLMFWLVQPSVSQGFLSPQQGRVVRAGPLPGFP